jgi:hypothetical protein
MTSPRLGRKRAGIAVHKYPNVKIVRLCRLEMINDLVRPGYAASMHRERIRARHTVCVQLIATVALVVSLAVAVTAISIGIARAGASPLRPTQTTFLG